MAKPLTANEQAAIGVLRNADEHWLPYRMLCQRTRPNWRQCAGASRTLQRRGILVSRALHRGMPGEREVSFARKLKAADLQDV